MKTAKIRTSKLRAIHHLTQAALARKAKLSKTTISNLESGHQTKIALETIAKLCRAFDCTPAELFDLDDNEDEKIVKQQKEALQPFIGSLKYNKPFIAAELDSDLAKITNAKRNREK